MPKATIFGTTVTANFGTPRRAGDISKWATAVRKALPAYLDGAVLAKSSVADTEIRLLYTKVGSPEIMVIVDRNTDYVGAPIRRRAL